MTDNSQLNLDYGHLGEVAYDSTNRKWTSSRALHFPSPIKTLEPLETYLSAQLSSAPQRSYNSASRSDYVRNLVRSRPELQPGHEIIYNYLSEALLEPQRLARLSGDLLAFGHAQYADRSMQSSGQQRSRLWPVAAVAAGSDGNKICLLEVKQRRKGWRENEEIFLDAMDLQNTAMKVWDGDSGPIRQVCFAPSSAGSRPYLAVRTSISIHILRPLHLPGYLDLKPLLVLQTPPQVNRECVDLTFNYWNSKQLAAVDTGGQFIVWDIHERYKHIEATESVRGQMQPTKLSPEEERSQPAEDGWRRILFATEGKSLILASRTDLQCYDLSGAFLGNGSALIKEHDCLCWIVDLRKNPVRDDELFVVTTQSVIGLRVTVQAGQILFESIISWRHHRDVNDLALRLAFMGTGSQDLRIMLYSRNESLNTIYALQYSENSLSPPVLQGAPIRYSWSGDVLKDIHFVNLPLRRKNGVNSAHHWSHYVRHWQAFALTSDLSLNGGLFHERSTSNPRIRTEPANWAELEDNSTGKKYKGLEETKALEDLDGFIMYDDVDDGSDSGLDAPSFTLSRRHIEPQRRQATTSQAASTVTNELVTRSLEAVTNQDTVDMAKFLNNFLKARQILAENDNFPLQTLISSIPKPLAVGDLDDAFKSASRLVSRFGDIHDIEDNRPNVAPLASIAILGLSDFVPASSNLTMDLLYRRLLSIYNKPLASHVRGKTRLKKENVVRQVAGAIFLASTGVRKAYFDADAQIPAAPMSSPHGINSSADALQSLASDSFAQSAARLGNYTKLTSTPSIPARPSSATIDPVSEILAHWKLHSDPSQYSYRDTTAALTGASNIIGSQMSAETREGIEAKLKRTRALEEMRRARELRKQGPDAKRRKLDHPFGLQSQPDPSGGPAHPLSRQRPEQAQTQASSQGQSQRSDPSQQSVLGVASQVEPGRHGGRNPLQRPRLNLPDRNRRQQAKKSGFH